MRLMVIQRTFAHTLIVFQVMFATSSFSFEISSGPNSKDSIIGATQDNSGSRALGYYPDGNSDLVGTGGGSGVRTTRNLVLGFTLPTLPAGTTVTGGKLKFEITGARDEGGSDPSLDAYLLNTVNPDQSGTSFYYQGVSGNSASAKLVGTTYIDVGSSGVSFADDQQDIEYTLNGEALTLLKSLYGDDNIPDQAEAFFRFNLSVVPGSFNLKRYQLDLANNESSLAIQHTDPNRIPTVSSAASALPNPVVSTTTAFAVLGADDGGEATLNYSWSTTGTPPAGVTFSPNGTNAAKNSTATFAKAGVYNLQVTITNAVNNTVTSSVTVTVNQTLTSITLDPSTASLGLNSSKHFSAIGKDQFGETLLTQPTFNWSIDAGGVGTVDTAGLFISGTGGGLATVRASSGVTTSTATVTVLDIVPPTLTSQPHISPNPVVVGESFVATAAADRGTITWNWGDGTTSIGNSVSHAYNVAGVYSVIVIATSPGGVTTQTTLSVFVSFGLKGSTDGGALQPGIFVNGSGNSQGSGKILCNYIRREKTTFTGSLSLIDLPASMTQSQLINESGKIIIGSSAEFVFILKKNAKGKSTNLPFIEFNINKNRFKFKARSKDLTQLIEDLGAPHQFEKDKSLPIALLVPVRLQIGNQVFLAMTFEFSYDQLNGVGKGVLVKTGTGETGTDYQLNPAGGMGRRFRSRLACRWLPCVRSRSRTNAIARQ